MRTNRRRFLASAIGCAAVPLIPSAFASTPQRETWIIDEPYQYQGQGLSKPPSAAELELLTKWVMSTRGTLIAEPFAGSASYSLRAFPRI